TNNLVDTDFTLASLTYTNNAASPGNYQGTYIAAGHTLTTTNGFTVGGATSNNSVANVIIAGSGTLVVSNGGFLVQQGFNGDGAHQALLDLSGLDNFRASVTRFGVGVYIINNASRSSGILYLARTNQIIANGTGPTNGVVVALNPNSGGNSANNRGSFL